MIDPKKILLAALVAGVVYWSLGYFFYYLIFADFFEANAGSAIGVYRDQPIIWAVALAQMGLGTITAGVCAYAPNVVQVSDGLKAGAVLGLLIGLASAFDLYGVTHVQNLTATVVDTLLWVIRGSVAGGAASRLLDRMDG